MVSTSVEFMPQVANPPVQSGQISYGPSYQMSYQKRSTADKSAVFFIARHCGIMLWID